MKIMFRHCGGRRMQLMIFQALFEHSSVGIIITDADGVIEQANPFASRIFGYGADEMLGQAIEILLPLPLRERHVAYRRSYVQNPHPRAMGSGMNLQAVKKDGTAFCVEVSLSFFESDGKRHIVSFINDIDERKRAEDQLRRLTAELEQKVRERTSELSEALAELGHTNQGLTQEMEQRKVVEAQIRLMLEREKELNELKSRFVSMASHEFRTPLGGILTSASLISRYGGAEDAPKRERHVQTIKKAVHHLTLVLNDFLSLDKLEQGKVAASPTTFTMSELVDEVAQEMGEASEAACPIVVEHQEPGLTLMQDREMLRNVLVNLLSNALKYSTGGTEVRLRCSRQGSDAQIEVADQGIGIPLEEQKHLFERFFRATNVATIKGTGLGLNIVRRYLDLMGGSIHFTSTTGRGTTFTVRIPMEKK